MLGLGIIDLQNEERSQLLIQDSGDNKEGKRRTGFLILCCKFGFKTVLNLGEFALQL